MRLEIPGVPPPLLVALVEAAAGSRLALVGGAVRDLMLHRHHQDPWRGLPDLDLVIEGSADELVARLPQALARAFVEPVGIAARSHDRFGTQQLELLLPGAESSIWLLDVATARTECYALPGVNPDVVPGDLEHDLARRDFTVNAMAISLVDGDLLDPFNGRQDLSCRYLRFLHRDSLRDDPTRLVRAARYAARLGFELAEDSSRQVEVVLQRWPWSWSPSDPPGRAPAALSTRLRMELELLMACEPWADALQRLQQWGGFKLLDVQLQADPHWRRRMRWAQKLGIELFPALLAGAAEPLLVAERLQLPKRQQRLLADYAELQRRLIPLANVTDTPSYWSKLLESPGVRPEAVGLAIASGLQPRRPLWRWWTCWRHVKAPCSATELMNIEGIAPGPELGERLRQLRASQLDQMS